MLALEGGLENIQLSAAVDCSTCGMCCNRSVQCGDRYGCSSVAGMTEDIKMTDILILFNFNELNVNIYI